MGTFTLDKRHGTKADMYFKEITNKILTDGCVDINPRPHWKDGTPAHTLSINGYMCQYDLSKGESPILTLRPVPVKTARNEIFWIYQEQSNDLTLLKEKYNVHYWDDWDIGDGTIGACYGETVRRHKLTDYLLEDIEKYPDGRHHILNLWQQDDFNDPHGLEPCCMMLNFNVRHPRGNDEVTYLDMALYQRSCDFITAASAINPAQYYILQCMVAYHFGYEPGIFTHFMNNIQIYDRHISIAMEMLERDGVDCDPKVFIDPPKKKSFYNLSLEDVQIVGYPFNKIKSINPNFDIEVAI